MPEAVIRKTQGIPPKQGFCGSEIGHFQTSSAMEN